MYRHVICEPVVLDDILSEINSSGESIISCIYLSDSQQVCLIVKGPDSKYSVLKDIFGQDKT